MSSPNPLLTAAAPSGGQRRALRRLAEESVPQPLLTNAAPTEASRQTLRGWAKELSSELVALRSKIDAIGRSLDDACQQEDQLVLVQQAAAGALSARNRLPADVIGRIFVLFCSEAAFIADVKAGPGLLMQVCSHWRAVAVDLPCLWNVPRFRSPARIPRISHALQRSPGAREEYVGEIIQRSRGLPVRLVLRGAFPGSCLPFADRVSRIEFFLLGEELPPHGPPLIGLLAASINARDNHWHPPLPIWYVDRAVDQLSGAPGLSTLTINFPGTVPSTFASRESQWPNLQRLRLQCPITVALVRETLSSVPNLRECVFSGQYYRDVLPPHPHPASLLDGLTCPKLCTLDVTWEPRFERAIFDLVSRSGCQITKLTLRGHCPLSFLCRFELPPYWSIVNAGTDLFAAPFPAELPSNWALSFSPSLRQVVLRVATQNRSTFFAPAMISFVRELRPDPTGQGPEVLICLANLPSRAPIPFM
ncbi:hypothetical protein C8R43DRAFT_1143667 [Mycena crocata]|nr:hypothetical protein C8R43DRAFT_1143667 [Mycena crocata]